MNKTHYLTEHLPVSLETPIGTIPFYQANRLYDDPPQDRAYKNPLIGGFTGRPLNLGGSALAKAQIQENRQLFSTALSKTFKPPSTTKAEQPQAPSSLAPSILAPDQTHGTQSKTNRDHDFSHTDAIIVLDTETPVMIQVADCVPIILYAPEQHIGAVIHAGWRGTASGITHKVAQRLVNKFNVDPTQLRAAIGPCASQAHYEVSQEVADAVTLSVSNPPTNDSFVKINPQTHKPHVDLQLANALQLEALGVKATHINRLPLCTIEDNDRFWSHRKGDTERQIAYLELLPK